MFLVCIAVSANYFRANVRTLCQKYTIGANLNAKSGSKRHSNRFRVSSLTSTIYCYCFLPFVLHKSGTRTLLFLYQTNKIKIIRNPLFDRKFNGDRIKIYLNVNQQRILMVLSCICIFIVYRCQYKMIRFQLIPCFYKITFLSISVLSVVASVLSLTLIAYDRFFGIVFALKAHMTDRRARTSLILIWISSTVIACPTLIYRELKIRVWKDHVERWCDDDWPVSIDIQVNNTISSMPSRTAYYVTVSVVLYFIPLIVMTFAYSLIIMKLWMSAIPVEKMDKRVEAQARARKKVLQLIILIHFSNLHNANVFLDDFTTLNNLSSWRNVNSDFDVKTYYERDDQIMGRYVRQKNILTIIK